MGLIFPVSSEKITSYFGKRSTNIAGASTYHEGIDIGVVSGTPVMAANSGVVIASGYNSTSGNYVKILGNDGLTTFYGHLSKSKVSEGQTVNAGDIIALSGNTGTSSGAHLHFGVYQNGEAINPLTLSYTNGTTTTETAATTGTTFNNDYLLILGAALLILAIFRG